MGPCVWASKAAAGGGHAQVLPMEDINLHLDRRPRQDLSPQPALCSHRQPHQARQCLQARPRPEFRLQAGHERPCASTTIGKDPTALSREDQARHWLRKRRRLSVLKTDWCWTCASVKDIVVVHLDGRAPVSDIGSRRRRLLRQASPNITQTLEGNPSQPVTFANTAHGNRQLPVYRTLALIEVVLAGSTGGDEIKRHHAHKSVVTWIVRRSANATVCSRNRRGFHDRYVRTCPNKATR